MKHLSLATRYRPQRFADVAGQPLAAVALSRAAAADKVAPAYLLSGTRGVGKTTIARIFAKVLNCANAPVEEPCNECSQCRHITAGNHVDVCEIDGASNTGVDDVRALRETIGFLPMEGRYKIFIIDEAHMLSKSAFNALLKTLEEPPAHTVFIFATTEAHRFPATIISRCQHYVFRHLSEEAIHAHLCKVLAMEQVPFEDGAVRLLARRAAGSVRDSLSLLDQALSLGAERLEALTVREALGVAGPELYAQLFEALAKADCGQIVNLAGGLLASGLDLAFFSRELSALLRNLFLMNQTKGKILSSLGEITEDEKKFLQAQAQLFTEAHLHAAWQLTLDSQRTIAQSPEPGAALELLLINIALLPQLLPVGKAEMPERSASVYPAAPTVEPGQTAKEEPGHYNAGKADSGPIAGTWEDFCQFWSQQVGNSAEGKLLHGISGSWKDGKLEITANGNFAWEQLEKNRQLFENTLRKYCAGNAPQICYLKPAQVASPNDYPEEIKMCERILGATVKETAISKNKDERYA